VKVRRWQLAARVTAALLFASAPALADVTKNQCLDANGKAQELRRDGKLSAAKDQLRVCISSPCPAMVRDDCTKRLDELETAQPTIAFTARDASGADLIDVRVTIDGKLLVDRLDGKPVDVDTGAHVFTFEVPGQPPVTRTLVLTEGEKGRRERVIIGSAGAPLSAPAAAPITQAAPVAAPQAGAAPTAALITGPEPTSAGGGMGTQKVLGLVAGGIGVVGVAVGSVFGAMAFSQKSREQSACGNGCTPGGHTQAVSDRSTGMTDGTISTVGFVAGGALLLGGAVLFFTAHHSTEGSAASGMIIVPSAGPSGGGLSLRGEF
jgi:hypothetical protein